MVVPATPGATVRLACPVGQSTRIIFPEPLRRLKGRGIAREALGLTVAQASPHAILVVAPPTHPARGTIEFQGPTLELRLDLTTAERSEGDTGDVRIVVESPPAREPATGNGRPTPDAGETPPGPATDTAGPDEGAARTEPLDLGALLAAEPLRIDRREGLPGQPEIRLTDALKAEKWVFFRLRLEDGVKTSIRRVAWDGGETRRYAVEALGDDLLIVVQLPREQVSSRTRLVVETETGIVYRISARPPTIPARFRELFR